MFAKLVSDHDRAVLAATEGCIIAACEERTAYVVRDRDGNWPYCQLHGDRLRRGLAPVQDGEC